MIAAYHGHSEVVQELLTSKADLDHQDQVSEDMLRGRKSAEFIG